MYSAIRIVRSRLKFNRSNGCSGRFRRRFADGPGAFALALALTVAGSAFGGLALIFDPNAKAVLMPFPELLGSPGDRVKKEEEQKGDRLANVKGDVCRRVDDAQHPSCAHHLCTGRNVGGRFHHSAVLQRRDARRPR